MSCDPHQRMHARDVAPGISALGLPMQRPPARFVSWTLCALLVCAAAPRIARAQAATQPTPQGTQTEQTTTPPPDSSANPNAPTAQDLYDPGEPNAVTLFPHSDKSRYWISGQANVVLQWHPTFPSKYSGKNSLKAAAENDTSKVYTLFLGYELTSTTEVFLDAESAGGHGIGEAFGLAGF